MTTPRPADIAAPKERPILFSGPMVRAILDGTKTQTRRLMNPQPTPHFTTDVDYWTSGKHAGELGRLPNSSPYGVPGDRLWVRETWGVLYPQYILDADEPTFYRADYTEAQERALILPKWRPSIFMRPARSRITLAVTGVRVERLQDISEEDARAEGVATTSEPDDDRAPIYTPARHNFEKLWDTINGKRAPWSSNSWVWVVAFERVS